MVPTSARWGNSSLHPLRRPLETPRDRHLLSTWATGETCAALAKTHAALDKAGAPDSPSSEKALHVLAFPLGLRRQAWNQSTRQARQAPQQGVSRPLDCLSLFGQGKNNKIKLKLLRAGYSMVNRGLRRQHQTRRNKKAERLEPTLFLVGCGFRTLIAPQRNRIRDSHIKTP